MQDENDQPGPALSFIRGRLEKCLELYGDSLLPRWSSAAEWEDARRACLDYVTGILGAKAAEKLVAAKQRTARALQKHVPSPYRIPLEHWVLARNQIQIEQAIRTMRMPSREVAWRAVTEELPTPKCPLVVADSLPSGKVNAAATQFAEQDEYVILARWGLGSFLNLTCKAVAQAFMDPGARPGALNFLRRILVCYYFWGDPLPALHPRIDPTADRMPGPRDTPPIASVADAYPLPDSIADLAYDIETGMHLFLMGHEYTHILHSHKAQSDQETAWAQEFDADDYGLQLMFEAMTFQNKFPDLVTPFVSADLFLSLIDMSLCGLRLLTAETSHDPGTTSHPPLLERRRRIRERFAQLSSQTEPIRQADRLAGILQSGWSPLARVLMELRRRGKRPHFSWQWEF